MIAYLLSAQVHYVPERRETGLLESRYTTKAADFIEWSNRMCGSCKAGRDEPDKIAIASCARVEILLMAMVCFQMTFSKLAVVILCFLLGTGGESIYGEKFEDEAFLVNHTKPFLLSMVSVCVHITYPI
jgi:hypothetical protein